LLRAKRRPERSDRRQTGDYRSRNFDLFDFHVVSNELIADHWRLVTDH
jgi:hypothetical protein